jgi:hypothetical protein
MKRILFLFVLLFPGYLFAQSDSLQALSTDVIFDETQEEAAPVLTYKDRREPILAGFLSYLCPGAGQVYNKQYEKALGIVAVIGYSYYQGVQSSGTGNDNYTAICALGICGAYFYSFFDAMISAKKINKAIELQLSRNTSMSLKPDFQLSRGPMAFGVSKLEPTVGLRLKLAL